MRHVLIIPVLALGMLLGVILSDLFDAYAASPMSWPVDKQAHFLAGYGIGLSSALAHEKLGLPVPGLLGFLTATAAGYAKEKHDAVYDTEDFQKTVLGGAAGCVFYWTINL